MLKMVIKQLPSCEGFLARLTVKRERVRTKDMSGQEALNSEITRAVIALIFSLGPLGFLRLPRTSHTGTVEASMLIEFKLVEKRLVACLTLVSPLRLLRMGRSLVLLSPVFTNEKGRAERTNVERASRHLWSNIMK